MADDVQVTFGANIQQLTEAVNSVKAQLSSLNGVVSQVGGYFSQLGNIGGIVATTLGAFGLEAFTRKMVESGLETEKLTTALGISGKQLATLKAIAGLTGVDMSSLALTMERLSLNVQRSTKDAFSPASEALKVLGLQAKDLIGLNADQYFFKIADAAAKFNPSLNLTNALMAIGGRGMTEMVAAFVKGGSEFRELALKIAAAKGEVDSFTKATMETHLQLGYMDATVGGLQKSHVPRAQAGDRPDHHQHAGVREGDQRLDQGRRRVEDRARRHRHRAEGPGRAPGPRCVRRLRAGERMAVPDGRCAAAAIRSRRSTSSTRATRNRSTAW
jgi:hypothetical protein